ncbi:MAG: ribonuclease HII [Demequina sp.]
MAVSLARESALWDAGAHVVAGIDEVGRGALAGPVSVGAVALTRCDAWPDGLADSKQLTPARRHTMADALVTFGAGRAVGHASADEIDAHGIVAALRIACMRALAQIADAGVSVDVVLLDGKHDYLTAPADDLWAASSPPAEVAPPPVTMVIGGDNLCASIAAGSVLAKVERDAMMVAAHADHPAYGWDGNKGYGAAAHLDALRTLGPTPLHRRSWKLPENATRT